ncbi:MAG: ComF family protein [Bacillota bacterium]|nr:ComF family protein [Bacillota bacterium]
MMGMDSWLTSLAELIFPAKNSCRLCGKETGYHDFCQSCLSRLAPVKEPRCSRCGKELGAIRQQLEGTGACTECRLYSGSFTYARAVGFYTGFLKEAIHSLKYVGKKSLAKPLASLMVDEIYKNPCYRRAQGVVAMPLHQKKLAERGFNQAELLAEHVAAELGLPLLEGLVRHQYTKTQSKLTRNERIANVEDAFSISENSFENKVVLLLDDVLTTGLSCHYAAKVLLVAQAKEVQVFTLALGHNMGERVEK